jgi:hypothetical protein
MSKSQRRTTLITFSNIKGTAHSEFIPQGQKMNHVYYVEILTWLCEAVCTMRPELWPNNWILHHDNAPTHKALSTSFCPKNLLLKWNTYPIPDLFLNDFWLFPKIKIALNG